MFQDPFSFDGRIRRIEYGISVIIYLVACVIVTAIMQSGGDAVIIGLAFIPLEWFLLAQGAKRCHDRGNSGWHQCIPFYSLWLLFANGDKGENEYGKNPKGIGNQERSTNA